MYVVLLIFSDIHSCSFFSDILLAAGGPEMRSGCTRVVITMTRDALFPLIFDNLVMKMLTDLNRRHKNHTSTNTPATTSNTATVAKTAYITRAKSSSSFCVVKASRLAMAGLLVVVATPSVFSTTSAAIFFGIDMVMRSSWRIFFNSTGSKSPLVSISTFIDAPSSIHTGVVAMLAELPPANHTYSSALVLDCARVGGCADSFTRRYVITCV